MFKRQGAATIILLNGMILNLTSIPSNVIKRSSRVIELNLNVGYHNYYVTEQFMNILTCDNSRRHQVQQTCSGFGSTLSRMKISTHSAMRVTKIQVHSRATFFAKFELLLRE